MKVVYLYYTESGNMCLIYSPLSLNDHSLILYLPKLGKMYFLEPFGYIHTFYLT